MAEHFASYSTLTTYRQCPQKWNYSYVRNLTKDDPTDVRVELEFGNWWHALRAADSIERGRELESLRYVPEKIKTVDDGPRFSTDSRTLFEDVREGAEKWWKSLPLDVQEQWFARIGDTLPDRLAYVDEEWRKQWGADTEFEHPLAVEMRWRRDMPKLTDPETGEVADPDTVMVGYVDEIYLDTRRNMVVARDHKTHRTLGTQSSVDDMMDSQLQVYSWGASPAVTEWGLGPIKAVAYDRVRMVAPKQPKITLSGTLSKAVKDFDLRTYLEFAAGPEGKGVPFEGRKKDGSGAGFYVAEEEVVANLSDPAAVSAWFQRTLTPLNRNIVMGHLRAAVDSAFDLIRSKRRVEESGEVGRNLTSACKWCPFAELCRAELNGGAQGDYDLAAFGLRQK